MSTYDEFEQTIEERDPMALAAKANDRDKPNWNQAMNGPYRKGFWDACKVEYNTLQDMDVWDLVDREPWMIVLPGTWAFKIKWYPDGLVKKLKARFCV